MSFVGDYYTTYTNKQWKKAVGNGYTDYIKHLIKKHARGGVYVDEEELRRGYFTYKGDEYMIRTWSIDEHPGGCNSSYTIFPSIPPASTAPHTQAGQ